MYKLLVVLCVFLFVQDEESIAWTQNQKLHWGNFEGEPKPNTGAVAITASGITYGFSSKTFSDSDKIEYTTDVEAQFYPDRSWYLKERVNDTILKHEQLHFDITELHARKLRKRIKNVKTTKNIQQVISKIYDEVSAELNKMQNDYDKGSEHSINYEGQVKWQKLIAKELQEHSRYRK
ncbi:hypothetical protein IMCC3317_42330 [Kordia antarctica]|uniref:DUF922 domain-containing protein n=1 Tax=Kordia antarctica TaxID=1218801 RepID=A0A7L4ZQ13_9FLAO|nr:DUF922 domain-containing protein [Kordia antarctica]QHI38833.1 hypothetical protein IMCC3317_42330 [Kordia antarctica]